MAAGLSISQVNASHILMFLEYLHKNSISAANIENYLSAVKTLTAKYGLSVAYFSDQRIQMFIKALKINRPLHLVTSASIDEHTLQKILLECDKFPHSVVYKSLYSFAFFSFLRLSNILPHSAAAFDCTRHLCRGDVIVTDHGATILIKWSKTLQDRSQVRTIVVPTLGDSPICPVVLLKQMFRLYPGNTNDPLYRTHSYPCTGLTDSMVRKHLKKISLALQIVPTLTFHMFRKAGTTWAFNHGVPLQDIMLHGTWSSRPVWNYVVSTPSASSAVSIAFQSYLLS